MINWLTALKFLPWSDMIEYAPKVVSGAQKVWQRVKTGKEAGELKNVDANALVPDDPALQLAALQNQLQVLQIQQLDMTNLIQELAGQNQRLVNAVDVLRLRTRTLWLVLVLNIIATVTIAILA